MLKRSLKKEELKLVLVLSGNTVLIKDFIEKHKNLLENNNIIIYSELSYKDLIILYKTSLALLIPLRKNIQDKARFSHKIGEYLASGRPIITTYWGEIKYEFIHSINALIAQDYSIESYAKMMQIAYEKPDMSDRIGDKGRKLCKEKYSYLKYGKILSEFFTKS
jgi:glycosyltransferase involved in cell wall biosynthesis